MEKKEQKFDEKKKKIIFLSVIGMVVLIMVIFAITDVNNDDEQITELEVPESGESKIDSKTEALGTDSISNNREVDLNTIYQEDTKKKAEIENEKQIEELRQKIRQASGDSDEKKETYREEQRYNSAPKRTNTTTSKTNNVVYVSTPKEVEKPVVVAPSKPVAKKDSGFFKKPGKENSNSSDDLNIYACIHTNQTIMNNQRVKFRTTKEFTYNGEVYPINTIVYGLAQIRPNRLIIKINRINQTDIKLDVFDSEDSQQGLYVLTPNLNASLAKEMKRESLSDDDLQKIPFSKSLKNIFEKKAREEKVQLLNNYKVLIKISTDEKI